MQHCIIHCTPAQLVFWVQDVCGNTFRSDSRAYDLSDAAPAVKIPNSLASNDPPPQIPVFDSDGVPIGFARYYHDGYRIAILPDFEHDLRNKPQTRTLISDDSGKISGITIAISDNSAI